MWLCSASQARATLKYYEAGMDLSLSESRIESFKIFQQHILNEYDNMVDEFNLTVIDGNLTVQAQQRLVREIVKQEIEGWEGLPTPEARPQSPYPRKANTTKGKA